MNTDLYETLAGRYDLEGSSTVETNSIEAAFFRWLIAENNIHDVLDCACGTGRHLVLFQELGCQVWGTDISAAMLRQATAKLARLNYQIPLKKVDYRALPGHFPHEFDAVLCLGAIGYMTSEDQFMEAFSSMYGVLRPGGSLILTTLITDRQWIEKPQISLVVNTSDFTRLFVMDYQPQSVCYSVLDIFHSQAVNKLESWSAELSVLLSDGLERLLKKSGFTSVDFYGSFDGSPYYKRLSKHLICVAGK